MKNKKHIKNFSAIGILKWNDKKFLLAVLLSIFIFGGYSCRFIGGDKDQNCRRIIPIEQMVEILHDLYLMEGYVLANGNLQVDDTLDYYFAGVFRKHEISYDKFKNAMDCYLFNKDDMDSIHNIVLEKISKREAQVLKRGLIFHTVDQQETFKKHPDCYVANICY
jgi:hypothetical protein